jgi:hypothetical protein
MGVIQTPKPELCFMRYELTDYEWAAVRFGVPLPNKRAAPLPSLSERVAPLELPRWPVLP